MADEKTTEQTPTDEGTGEVDQSSPDWFETAKAEAKQAEEQEPSDDQVSGAETEASQEATETEAKADEVKEEPKPFDLSDWEKKLAETEEKAQDKERWARSEKKQRQALETENASYKQIVERLADRLGIEAGDQAEEAPSIEEKPIEFIQSIGDRLDRMEAAQAEAAETEKKQREQAEQIQGLVQDAEQSAARFSQDYPDYFDAVGHLRELRKGELTALGVQPNQIEQKLNLEELQFVNEAKALGRDIAASAYQLALQRGYQPKASEGKTTVQAEDPEPEKTKAEKRIDAASAAEKAVSKLSAGGSKPANKEVTVDAAVNAGTTKEFNKMFAELRRSALRNEGRHNFQ